MEFRTPIQLKPSPLVKIDHQTPILTVGSCFANVMGEKLYRNKFKVLPNPFGVVFNPLSIFKLINAACEGKNLSRDAYIQNQGIWYNFDFHSDFSSTSKEELESKISRIIEKVKDSIKTTKVITLTFGTSFVYKLNLTDEVVANCHKVPSFNFEKSLLTVHDIFKGFEKLHLAIKYINPDIRFILTVSPVRHIKDGIEANSVSKSILRLACHSICEKFDDVEYFPAYEIIMDDLRDYRFYKEDMIHPSEVAENYIWDKFIQKHITDDAQKLLKEWDSIMKAIEHKPFHADSDGYRFFLQETINKVKGLSKAIDTKAELQILEKRLSASESRK